MLDDKRLLEFLAIKACMAASRSILEIYQSDFEVETKADDSPVTMADLNSDKIIREILMHSNIPVLSEEVISQFDPNNTPLFWCVDPLDGTREFVNKTGEFAINIALIENGIPIFGAVCSPINSCVWYTSTEGLMKYDFGNHDVQSIAPEYSKSYFTLVYGSLNTEGKQAYDLLVEKIGNAHTIKNVKVGSATKFGWLIEGRADLYVRLGNTSIWDTAAGHALLRMAGGELINLETKEELKYNLNNLSNPHFVAFNPHGKILFHFLTDNNLL